MPGQATHRCLGLRCDIVLHNLCSQKVLETCEGGSDGYFYCSQECFYSKHSLPGSGGGRPAEVGAPGERARSPSRLEPVYDCPIYQAFNKPLKPKSSQAAAEESTAVVASQEERGARNGLAPVGRDVQSSYVGGVLGGDDVEIVAVNEAEGRTEEGHAAPEEVERPEGTSQKFGGARMSRRTQKVAPVGDRMKVQRWMISQLELGSDKIPARAMQAFPLLFSYTDEVSRQSACKKARRWFADAKKAMSSSSFDARSTLAFTRRTNGVRKISRVKALSGRGVRREAWVEALHKDLNELFRHVRRAGVMVNLAVLRELALELVRDAPMGSPYHASVKDKRRGEEISKSISGAWIGRFADRFNIVTRDQTGKLQCSEKKENELKRSVVIHLGKLCREFRSGELDEDRISNMDETCFKIDMDGGKTLEYAGAQAVKYCDVVSGGQNFTMMVHVSGGRRGVIEPPFMVFQNKGCNYPIKGCPDDVPGISYRTGKKGWMDQRVMALMLKEGRFIKKRADGRKHVIYLDNVGSHNLTPELQNILDDLNIELRYFPPCTTDLTQPCDSFVIQIIKAAWRKKWENKKARDVMDGEFRDGAGGSGKLLNPGKHYFLKLGAEAVHTARLRTDDNGLNYARKAMILCGLSLDTDGIWRVKQLKKELRDLVQGHRALFDSVVDGTFVESEDEEDREDGAGSEVDGEAEMAEEDDGASGDGD